MKSILRLSLFFGLVISGATLHAQHTFRILSYNILEGMKTDTTKGKQVFVSWIKKFNPDVLALQECNGFTQQSLEELAASYGHPYAVIVKEKGYPTGLTSRYPITNIHKVNENMTHGFITANVQSYNILVLHLNPHRYRKRREEIATVLETIAGTKDKNNWVIMGDFNSNTPLEKDRIATSNLIPWQQSLVLKNPKIENLVNGNEVDFEVQQHMLDAHFTDALHAYDLREKSRGGSDTMRTKTRIDYIYLSKNLAKKTISCKFIYDDFTGKYSDHKPVLLDMNK